MSGIAWDDSGTFSAMISWKTVIESNSVIPTHNKQGTSENALCLGSSYKIIINST